jgi:uncharacterized membrane protein
MSAWMIVVFWWSMFGASHMLLSSLRFRPQLVKLMGPVMFAAFYSLIALGIFIPLTWYYIDHRHSGPLLWNLSGYPGVRTLAVTLATLGLTLAIAGFLQPSPLGATPGARPKPHGLTRITRHPGFLFLGLWGLAHTLMNSFASDVAFFGGFAVFALIGCRHQDLRKRLLEKQRLAQFFEETSFWPFAAILTGRNRLVASELPWLGLAVGLAAAAGAYWLHGFLLAR